jgi:hypothetical protein
MRFLASVTPSGAYPALIFLLHRRSDLSKPHSKRIGFPDTASFKWGYPNYFGVLRSRAFELSVASAVPINPYDFTATTQFNLWIAHY